MIVVKLELWPLGDESRSREIGRIHISNDGTGTEELGEYHVVVAHGGLNYGKKGHYKKGVVRSFRRALSPYHLLASALSACGIK